MADRAWNELKWSGSPWKKNKEEIQKATEELKIAGEKYFASVPFPEVEKLVGKQMLKTYMGYIPQEQRINIFKVIDSICRCLL